MIAASSPSPAPVGGDAARPLRVVSVSLGSPARDYRLTLRVLGRVHLPLMRTGILAAALLVFVDTFKELPATMFLRPFGMETLSVWTYMLASESAWQAAGVPSLVIVISSAMTTLLLMRLPWFGTNSQMRAGLEGRL